MLWKYWIIYCFPPHTHIYTYRHTKISCSMSLLRPGIPYSTLLSSFIMLTHSLRVTSGVVFSVSFPQNLNGLRVPFLCIGCTSILKFIVLFWRLSLCVCLSHKPMIYPKTGTMSYSSSYPQFQMQLLSIYICCPETPFDLVHFCIIQYSPHDIKNIFSISYPTLYF